MSAPTMTGDFPPPPPPEPMEGGAHPDVLPAYAIHDVGAPPDFASVGTVGTLAAQTANMSVSSIDPYSERPSREQVMAHLKFLHAVHALRQSISMQDGLFNLHDSDIRDAKAAGHTDELRKLLSEKRWEVYVARAVERFTAWWNSLRGRIGTQGARLADFEVTGRLDTWVRDGMPEGVIRTRDDLPPLDVLMVWHSYMLNPRSYLDDCATKGMMRLWHNGMPWSAIDSCTDTKTGYYDPGENARQSWEANTGLAWINSLDPSELELACPYCRENGQQNMMVIPWTTYDVRKARLEKGVLEVPPGNGYSDSDFQATCTKCQKKTDHKKLRASKFTMDVRERFFGDGRMLAGTVLQLNGTLKSTGNNHRRTAHLYPTFLMEELLKLRCKGAPVWNTMEDVRLDIEATHRDNHACLESSTHAKNKSQRINLDRTERIMTRRMMSRYWENSSPFAVDLVGAVIRQGTFIEKMEHIDWLHSSTAPLTIDTALTKYARFMQMIADNMMQMMVPTLEVDLCWHTHQLSPPRYYAFSTSLHGALALSPMTPASKEAFRPGFIDHDDKIEESKLSDAFATTSDLYQKKYRDAYSLCTCWYCETARARGSDHVISHAKDAVTQKAGGFFRRKKSSTPAVDPAAVQAEAAAQAVTQSIEKQLYNPYKPMPSEPSLGPHISSHSAVRPVVSDRNKQMIAMRLGKEKDAVDKARKTATRKGRHFRPPVEAPGWKAKDADILLKAFPYTEAPFLTNPEIHNELYPAGPLAADFRLKGHANCAAGTCGGQVAGGSCGAYSSASVCANGAAAGCGSIAGNKMEHYSGGMAGNAYASMAFGSGF